MKFWEYKDRIMDESLGIICHKYLVGFSQVMTPYSIASIGTIS